MSNMSVNNVVCLFDRQPYVAPTAPDAMTSRDYLAKYAEVAQDEVTAAADLMTPALAVHRNTPEEMQQMVRADVRDAIDTLRSFHDAASTARLLAETLQAAEAKLSLAIHAVTYQHAGADR